MSQVRVLDQNSKECLFSCSIQDLDKAYEYARQLEEMGVEFTVEVPSLPETLMTSLGADQETVDLLKGAIDEEIESHNGCCMEPGKA